MSTTQKEAATSSTSLFSIAPQQTNGLSQGSVLFYKDTNCGNVLSSVATPLILNDCLNIPTGGIVAIQINSLPNCTAWGTPLFLVSNLGDCKASTAGSTPNTGVVKKCMSFSKGDEIGSVMFSCFGAGMGPVSAGASMLGLQQSAMLLILQAFFLYQALKG
jgi:hypothetical protein